MRDVDQPVLAPGLGVASCAVGAHPVAVASSRFMAMVALLAARKPAAVQLIPQVRFDDARLPL